MKFLIFGASGMAGPGVLHEYLATSDVDHCRRG